MTQILLISQIIVAIIMTVLILMQQRGASLGGAFGGQSAVYRSRRGVEKWLFRVSIVVSIIFIAISIGILFY
jgi:preprotein translocase subunit SecG